MFKILTSTLLGRVRGQRKHWKWFLRICRNSSAFRLRSNEWFPLDPSEHISSPSHPSSLHPGPVIHMRYSYNPLYLRRNRSYLWITPSSLPKNPSKTWKILSACREIRPTFAGPLPTSGAIRPTCNSSYLWKNQSYRQRNLTYIQRNPSYRQRNSSYTRRNPPLLLINPSYLRRNYSVPDKSPALVEKSILDPVQHKPRELPLIQFYNFCEK